MYNTPKKKGKGDKDKKRPYEPPLFRKSGENKIGLRFWQKVEAGLRPVPDTLSPHTARPDRNHGLDGVIPRAARITLGL